MTPLRSDVDRSHHTAYGIQRTAPKSTKKIELPFNDPAVVVMSANAAAQRHGFARAARSARR